MSEEQSEVEVYESHRFEKALKKLSDGQLKVVEDEIDKIIADPFIGELKKGDLSYLRVHKFNMNNQRVLLGYSYVEDKLKIYLLQFGVHENYYQKMVEVRKTDLKLIKP
jgi:mRNA-degrading endonuclease RelE of RelBE toxin-antitoxin system